MEELAGRESGFDELHAFGRDLKIRAALARQELLLLQVPDRKQRGIVMSGSNSSRDRLGLANIRGDQAPLLLVRSLVAVWSAHRDNFHSTIHELESPWRVIDDPRAGLRERYAAGRHSSVHRALYQRRKRSGSLLAWASQSV